MPQECCAHPTRSTHTPHPAPCSRCAHAHAASESLRTLAKLSVGKAGLVAAGILKPGLACHGRLLACRYCATTTCLLLLLGQAQPACPAAAAAPHCLGPCSNAACCARLRRPAWYEGTCFSVRSWEGAVWWLGCAWCLVLVMRAGPLHAVAGDVHTQAKGAPVTAPAARCLVTRMTIEELADHRQGVQLGPEFQEDPLLPKVHLMT